MKRNMIEAAMQSQTSTTPTPSQAIGTFAKMSGELPAVHRMFVPSATGRMMRRATVTKRKSRSSASIERRY
jgi:hypothetical protein